MGIAVHHSPAPGKDRAFSLCFSDNWRPLWAPREEEPLLLDDISTGAIDIEVKTPIDMVLMRHAGARVARAGESESGPDGAVVPQPPVRDIAIPPRLHFAHQPKLTVVIPQRDALKVACVRSRLEDRGGRLGAQPPAGSHRISAHSEKRSFLILPIPVCHAVVVQDIENRHMGPPQAEPATVTDLPKVVGEEFRGRTTSRLQSVVPLRITRTWTESGPPVSAMLSTPTGRWASQSLSVG